MTRDFDLWPELFTSLTSRCHTTRHLTWDVVFVLFMWLFSVSRHTPLVSWLSRDVTSRHWDEYLRQHLHDTHPHDTRLYFMTKIPLANCQVEVVLLFKGALKKTIQVFHFKYLNHEKSDNQQHSTCQLALNLRHFGRQLLAHLWNLFIWYPLQTRS